MAQRFNIFQTWFRAVRDGCYGAIDDVSAPIRSALADSRNAPDYVSYLPSLGLGDVANGRKIFDGRIKLGSQVLDMGSTGDPWSNPAPSQAYAHRLHGFTWLDDLATLQTDKKTRKTKPTLAGQISARATKLIDRWIIEFGQWNRFAWQNDVLVHRIYAWMCHWSVLLEHDKGSVAYDERQAALFKQVRRIRKIYKRLDSGLLKMQAGAVLVIADIGFQTQRRTNFARDLDWLDDEVEVQILADGGHISRSPQSAIDALEILLMTDAALEAAGLDGSQQLRRAIDRLSSVVSFFLAPDGGTFAFNGSGYGQPAKISSLQGYAKIKAKAFGYAPNSKYQRLDRNQTVIMMDTGKTPPRPYDLNAHLAPLAMELATEAGRLIVNCGWNIDQPSGWREAMRYTAAHSTLILDGQSVGNLLRNGLTKRVWGPGVKTSVDAVRYSRKEEDSSIWLDGTHETYRDQYGLSHRRRVFMDVTGNNIRGEDSLFVPLGGTPKTREGIPFDIRFHIHPSVKVTLAQDQNSALLIQPGKIGWQFKTDGGPLKLEKSVYLSEGWRPRRTEQIVISGRAYGDGDGQTRSNRVRWSLKRMGEL